MFKLRHLFISVYFLLTTRQNIALERYAYLTESTDEEDILELIEDSTSFKPLKEKFCDKVIASYPKKVRQIVDKATTNKLKKNCLIIYGASGVGKSLLARIIAQKNDKPFLLVRSYFIENRTSENLCKIATAAAEKNCNIIIEEIEVFIKEELRHQNETIRPLSNMLKILQRHNLLLIGTTCENQSAITLKRKLDVMLCQLDVPQNILATVRTINASLIFHKGNVDSAQTIVDFAQLVSNRTQGTIEDIVSLTYEQAFDDENPIITLNYLKASLKIINRNSALLKGQCPPEEL
jgi:hypothetical protein